MLENEVCGILESRQVRLPDYNCTCSIWTCQGSHQHPSLVLERPPHCSQLVSSSSFARYRSSLELLREWRVRHTFRNLDPRDP